MHTKESRPLKRPRRWSTAVVACAVGVGLAAGTALPAVAANPFLGTEPTKDDLRTLVTEFVKANPNAKLSEAEKASALQAAGTAVEAALSSQADAHAVDDALPAATAQAAEAARDDVGQIRVASTGTVALLTELVDELLDAQDQTALKTKLQAALDSAIAAAKAKGTAAAEAAVAPADAAIRAKLVPEVTDHVFDAPLVPVGLLQNTTNQVKSFASLKDYDRDHQDNTSLWNFSVPDDAWSLQQNAQGQEVEVPLDVYVDSWNKDNVSLEVAALLAAAVDPNHAVTKTRLARDEGVAAAGPAITAAAVAALGESTLGATIQRAYNAVIAAEAKTWAAAVKTALPKAAQKRAAEYGLRVRLAEGLTIKQIAKKIDAAVKQAGGTLWDTDVASPYGLKVGQTRLTVQVGKTLTIPATAHKPEGGKAAIEYTSSDRSGLAVSSGGKVRGKKAGWYRVALRSGTHTTTVAVRVVTKAQAAKAPKKSARKLRFNAVPSRHIVRHGTVDGVTATGTALSVAGAIVTYTSNRPKVLAVNKAGMVTAKKAGWATITARAAGVKTTVRLHVTAAE